MKKVRSEQEIIDKIDEMKNDKKDRCKEIEILKWVLQKKE